ncbi:MAG: hypothetical protein SFX74_01815 [Fimbriimonadaceae bacterium]|nr:hypothetical protein [Fimbriimonadaceae bacterium]
MPGLWRIGGRASVPFLGFCGITLLSSGCTGQSVQGAWYGAFPACGNQCRIRLFSTRQFDLECQRPQQSAPDLWAGRYRFSDGRLQFEIDRQTKAGATKVDKVFREISATVEGSGNRMTLTFSGSPPVEWTRGPAAPPTFGRN